MQREVETSIPLHRPDFRESFFFFLSGIISGVPFTLLTEQFADTLVVSLPLFYAILISSVLIAPFLEEFAKAFPLLYRHGETERSIFDLGLLIGLGFGIFEFVTYVFLLEAPVFLRLPGVLFHAASTSITAYGIATKRTVTFYLVAVGLLLKQFCCPSLSDNGRFRAAGTLVHDLILRISRNIPVILAAV